MSQSPIKRSPELVKLSRDHHFGLLLVWKTRQGMRLEVAAPRIASFLLETFRMELEPHFRQEELCLLPLLPADDPLRVRTEQEHVLIRSLCIALEQDITYERLADLANLLDAHIRFEERELFGHIEAVTALPELKAASDRAARMPQPEPFAWADDFWAHK